MARENGWQRNKVQNEVPRFTNGISHVVRLRRRLFDHRVNDVVRFHSLCFSRTLKIHVALTSRKPSLARARSGTTLRHVLTVSQAAPGTAATVRVSLALFDSPGRYAAAPLDLPVNNPTAEPSPAPASLAPTVPTAEPTAEPTAAGEPTLSSGAELRPSVGSLLIVLPVAFSRARQS